MFQYDVSREVGEVGEVSGRGFEALVVVIEVSEEYTRAWTTLGRGRAGEGGGLRYCTLQYSIASSNSDVDHVPPRFPVSRARSPFVRTNSSSDSVHSSQGGENNCTAQSAKGSGVQLSLTLSLHSHPQYLPAHSTPLTNDDSPGHIRSGRHKNRAVPSLPLPSMHR